MNLWIYDDAVVGAGGGWMGGDPGKRGGGIAGTMPGLGGGTIPGGGIPGGGIGGIIIPNETC